MKNKNIDETVQYDLKPELDSILDTYEKTSDSAAKDSTENSSEEEVQQNDTKSFSKKKLIALAVSLCAVAVIVVGAILLFGGNNKTTGSIVVKKSDGSFAVVNSDGAETIEYSISEYKLSQSKTTMAFNDKQKLYVCRLSDSGEKDFVSTVSEVVAEEYYVFDSHVVYVAGEKVFSYSISDRESKEIASDILQLTVPENSDFFIYTEQSDDRKELYLCNFGGECIKLSDNVEEAKIYIDSQAEKIVYAEKSDNLYTIKICDANGETKVVASETEYYYLSDDDVCDGNVYYFTESEEVSRTSIVFEDKMKDSDSKMTEPRADDYKKNLGILGIIQYTDSKAYKQAYLEYQDKLARDNARDFAANYVSSQSTVTQYDAYCYSKGSSTKVASSVIPDRIIAYSGEGTPRVLYEKVVTTVSTTLEISDIAKEIQGGDSQIEFNKLVDSKVTSDVQNLGLYVSASVGDFNANGVEVDGESEISFSPDGNTLLTEKSSGENIRLCSYRLSDGSVRKQLDCDVKSYGFSNNSFWVLRSDGKLCCSATTGNYSDCQERAEKVFSFNIENDAVVAYCANENGGTDAYLIGESTKTLVAENTNKLSYYTKNNIYFVSNEELCHYNGQKSQVIEKGVSEILF